MVKVHKSAAATSDLADRVQTAIKQARDKIGKERMERLLAVKRRADELSKRGLLRKAEYSESSSADLRKRYLSSKVG